MMADYNQVLLPTGQRIFLTHGHTYNGDNPPSLSKGDIIASGHTHVPMAQWQGEFIVFNPGSVAIPRNGHPASYGLLQGNRFNVISFAGDELAALSL